ncbi:ankyrin repeat domain-containing protein [bacterium]|nr:ankyrin repeat domain-containing protein [bacterium]
MSDYLGAERTIMHTPEEIEEAFLEAKEFAAVGEDIRHWAFLLEHAAWERREDMLEFLLSHGMDGAPILHALAYGDDQPDLRLRLIKLCHRFGATVPLETSESGDTSVHSAAGSGQLEILKYLVEEMDGHAAFRKVNDLDRTPLHEAVANGRFDCAQYLLEMGHDPNATAHVLCDDQLGWSILHLAVKGGHDEMVRLLLDWRADPDFPGWMWTTARDAAAGTRFEEMLAVPRLARPKLTPHRAEIERQLLLGHPDGVSVNWRGSRPAGAVKQLRGQPLQGVDDLQLLDTNGEVVKRGRFRFLILTAEQDLRCFWLEQDGVVPDSILAGLTEDQRSDLVMDPRNSEFRADLDRRSREGWGSCPQG